MPALVLIIQDTSRTLSLVETWEGGSLHKKQLQDNCNPYFILGGKHK